MQTFKYRCRGCRMQDQCIEASDTSLGAKEMIRNAFAARTDTINTWGVLQKNCLLLKLDEEHEQRAKERATVLSRRLQEARSQEQTETPPGEEAPKAPGQSGPLAKPVFSAMIGETPPDVTAAPRRPAEPTTAAFRAEPSEARKTHHLDSPRTTQPFAAEPAPSRWLIINASQRRISLPFNGEVTLGRFDPTLTTPLDVDLAWEDQNSLSISRRHARIVATNGRHVIRDLNSSNGVYINEIRGETDQAYPLQPDDRVTLGQLEMIYTAILPGVLESLLNRASKLRHYLLLANTGHQFFISPPNTVTLGRTDPTNDIWPSIDLGAEGELANYVSRRHASLTWDGYRPYLADLGSSFGTRLNGELLRPHQAVALNPGDHISLGGCVLGYDLED